MSTLSPSAFVFVAERRGTDVADLERLRGRIGHVQSGRRHDFDTAASLLACLRHELEQVCRCDGDARDGGARPQGAAR